MKKYQYFFKIHKFYIKKSNSKSNKIEIPLPKELHGKKCEYYITPGGNSKPISLIYGKTYWILNEGHEFSVTNNTFKTHSDLFKHDRELMILSGDEIELNCENGHIVEYSDQNYCGHCGVKINHDELLKNIIVKTNYEIKK